MSARGLSQRSTRRRMLAMAGASATAAIAATPAFAQQECPAVSVYTATLAEPNQKTPEISTEEMRRILADRSAVVIDARKHPEFVAGHVASAKTTMQEKDGPPADVVVPVVLRLVGGDKSKAVVLYCNGPHCVASRRLGEQLVAAGYTNVRRYQLGMPMWRLVSGPVEIEMEGILRVYRIDQTAVFLDARPAEDFAKHSLPGTHNVPAAEGLSKAPLPHDDFNTRIVLFGGDAAQARALADSIAKTPFQNVSYFPGTFEELAAAVKAR